jgi:hypothetical protein
MCTIKGCSQAAELYCNLARHNQPVTTAASRGRLVGFTFPLQLPLSWRLFVEVVPAGDDDTAQTGIDEADHMYLFRIETSMHASVVRAAIHREACTRCNFPAPSGHEVTSHAHYTIAELPPRLSGAFSNPIQLIAVSMTCNHRTQFKRASPRS